MKKRLAFLPLIFFVLLAGMLLVGIRHGNTGKFALHIGEQVPTTTLPVVGQPYMNFATNDWHGRPYVLNFFASWCAACRAEHETLLKLSKMRVTLIGIDFKDNPDAVRSYLEAEGDPFLAVAEDPSGHTWLGWALTGVPETFLIDAKGIIRFHLAGPLTDEIVEEQLLPLWREMAQ